MKVELLAQPDGQGVGRRLLDELDQGDWDGFRCAVAFAKLSGVRYLDPALRKFVGGGGWATLSIGIDSEGTSFEALSQLASAVGGPGRLFIAQDPLSPAVSFHPKIYALVKGDPATPERVLAIVGSSNITRGGLFDNHEASLALDLDGMDAADAEAIGALLAQLDAWHDKRSADSTVADAAVLLDLHRQGRLPSELQMQASRRSETPRGRDAADKRRSQRSKAPAPKEPMGPPLIELPPQASHHIAFFIDVPNDTDKTEIYLSKIALSEDPGFFGHPFTGRTKPKRSTSTPQPERDPRPLVDIRLLDAGGKIVDEYTDHGLKMWQYALGPSANQDVRITVPQMLRRSIPDECVLEMRREPIRSGIEYRLDFLAPGSVQWENARAHAARSLPGGKRKMGWE